MSAHQQFKFNPPAQPGHSPSGGQHFAKHYESSSRPSSSHDPLETSPRAMHANGHTPLSWDLHNAGMQGQQMAHGPQQGYGAMGAAGSYPVGAMRGSPGRTAREGREGRRVSFSGGDGESDLSPLSSTASSYPSTSTTMYSRMGGGPEYVPDPEDAVSIRNTRPMTAPSSVTAPYFFGQNFSNPGQLYMPATSIFPDQPFAFGAPPPPSDSHGTFQHYVDNSTKFDAYRARGLSLPEMAHSYTEEVDPTGGRMGLPDMPDYASPSRKSSLAMINEHHPSNFQEPSYDSMLPPAGYSAGGHQRSAGTWPPAHPSTNNKLAQNRVIRPSVTVGTAVSAVAPAEPTQEKGKTFNFVNQPGKSSKRPRRRYEEIERLYGCDYPGCQKGYGTLNHLNSHKLMQKHGPKSTPAQFKEQRKEWRQRKKAAAQANNTASSRPSTSQGIPMSSTPATSSIDHRRHSSAQLTDYHPIAYMNGFAPAPAPLQTGHFPVTAGAPPEGAAPLFFPPVPPPQEYTFPPPTHRSTALAFASAAGGDPSVHTRPVTAPSFAHAPQFGHALYHPQPHAPAFAGALAMGGHGAGPLGEPFAMGPPGAATSQRRGSLPVVSQNDLMSSLTSPIAPPFPMGTGLYDPQAQYTSGMFKDRALQRAPLGGHEQEL